MLPFSQGEQGEKQQNSEKRTEENTYFVIFAKPGCTGSLMIALVVKFGVMPIEKQTLQNLIRTQHLKPAQVKITGHCSVPF
jgi:hypothetical protein